MIISIIVAVSDNNVIGKDNKLPWHLPADLKYFKQKTLGHHMVMGRKTFEALGKPLPGRTHVVISRQENLQIEGCTCVTSLEAAIDVAKKNGEAECFVIGGGEIFIKALMWVDRIYLTRVHHDWEGDTFFHPLNKSDWKEISEDHFPPDEKNPFPYTFFVYERNG